MKNVLPKIISESQTGYLKGRKYQDFILYYIWITVKTIIKNHWLTINT